MDMQHRAAARGEKLNVIVDTASSHISRWWFCSAARRMDSAARIGEKQACLGPTGAPGGDGTEEPNGIVEPPVSSFCSEFKYILL